MSFTARYVTAFIILLALVSQWKSLQRFTQGGNCKRVPTLKTLVSCVPTQCHVLTLSSFCIFNLFTLKNKCIVKDVSM